LYHLNHLPGILDTEEFRTVPVRLHHRHYQYRLAITGLPQDGELRQLMDRQLHQVPLPLEGLVLTSKLAEILHLQPGDFVQVEVLEGEQPQQQLPVTGLVDEMIGLSAYMNLDALNRMMGEGRTISGAYALIDAAEEDTLYRELKQMPAIEGVSFRDALIQSFKDISGENLLVMTGILVTFSCIITFSVVYNSARIALSERGRELASLRIMGFTQTEIAIILLGEQAILTAVAIPVGIAFGIGLSALMVQAYDSELYRLPFVISRSTYGFTTMIVIVAALISGVIIYRQLQKLDLIAVLKTRE
jgi:putative ABC transport system permease protein